MSAEAMSNWKGVRLRPRPTLAEQAATDLRLAIRDRAFGTDGQLPSEPTLSRQLGVSRPTVRQAISLLEQEGLVVRRQGLGTFVISTVAALRNILNANSGITDMIQSGGQSPGTSRVVVKLGTADGVIARHLAVEPDSAIAIVERTRTADRRPVAMTRDFIATDLLSAHGIAPEAIERFVRGQHSLYHGLNSVGIAVSYGIATVTPSRATEALRSALSLSEGALLLRLEQTDYTADGRPVLFSEEFLVPGPLSVVVFRRGPG
jgi:GntR family transcriptional regulator